MAFRLKTSRKTKEIFEEIGKSSNLKPFALSKIAVSLSLKDKTPIKDYIKKIEEEKRKDDKYEAKLNGGLELQRSTVTGEFDSIFKALIEINLGRSINDDEYYPYFMKLHMDRGAELLLNQYRYSGGNLEKFLTNALNKGDANL